MKQIGTARFEGDAAKHNSCKSKKLIFCRGIVACLTLESPEPIDRKIDHATHHTRNEDGDCEVDVEYFGKYNH